ncbi:MAG: chemotaxis protein CheB [Planctomycetaceae bacterium]
MTSDKENAVEHAGRDGPFAEATADGDPTFVVGLGASAGGLEALERVFRLMPLDTGMAFVVIQHLSPDFDSMMDELLNRQTTMPVHIVEDGVEIRANAVYLIPSGKEMIISHGRLLLTDKDPRDGLSLPIDQFFRSLASDYSDRSIGVVLSGTGSDGSRGICDIHEAGGLVIAQTEETAKFDGMPRSATETGVVDLLLSPEDIAPTLERYAKNPVIGDLPPTEEVIPVDEDSLNRLLRLLRVSHGIDFSFSFYKPGTVRRRIERRLLLNHATDFEQYVNYAEQDPEELNSLYRDLLIGVTQFFRDRDAFQILESQVIPELIAVHPEDEEFRVWIAGCATGEEAYSLAILLDEISMRMKKPLDFRIFATDVHKASLDFASAGVYPESSLGDISSERLSRYFEPRGSHYAVAQSLRRMVVFAQHNIIKDAPFTKLDLISCRNLLIYLQPTIQKKAISLFHFGLRTGGTLFLGPSENLADLETEFTTIDRHWKIFKKRRDARLPMDIRLPLSPGATNRLPSPTSIGNRPQPESELLELYHQVLDQCVPTAVLIDEQYHVLHIFGDADRYLKLQRGRPSYSLLSLLDNDVRTACAGAVQRATKEQKQVAYSGIRLERDDQSVELRLTVSPLQCKRSETQHLLVRFDELESLPTTAIDAEVETVDIGEVSRERTELLELDLRRTRESLQATIEELETSNEELHATNEEIVASNEELQSTNEELHSVNEELYTVNAEYQRKIAELTELTGDMQHLLESTDVGTVFLDDQLSIRKVTPRIARTFNILEQDIGRQFEGFSHNIDHPDLMLDIQRVLESSEPVECEVQDRRGQWFYLRILPYRSRGATDGVVVTLIDSQALHDARTELRETELLLQSILDNAPSFVFVRDEAGRYLLVNHEANRWFGVDAKVVKGKTDHDFLPKSVADRLQVLEREVIVADESRETEIVLPGRNEAPASTWLMTMFPLRKENQRVACVAGIATNITARKLAQNQVQRSLQQRDQFLAMLSHELRNPLSAMQNGLKLIERETDGPPAPPYTRAMLQDQVQQMSRLLDDLLDVTRIEHDRVDLRKSPVDLAAICRLGLAAVESRFEERAIELEVTGLDEELTVFGDPTRLQQIQTNLLINSVKYTQPGGKVRFSLARALGSAVMTVSDNGAGISEALLPHIFELFTQADDTLDRAEGGIGVGLSLAESLVELHNGTIEVRSEGPGRGSEFIVRLPLTKAVEPEVTTTIEDLGQLPSLFLVEDNDHLRNTLSALLIDAGYRVRAEDNGADAIQRICEEPPDVAIVDLGLPEIDGYEVARRLRKKFSREKLTLLAVTGYGQPEDQQAAIEAGFDQHLVKPVELDELKRVCSELVNRHKSE